MYMNHRRSKIYDKSDVVGIGKWPIFNLYYSQVENMIASLLDLIRIVSCSLKYVGSCKDFFTLYCSNAETRFFWIMWNLLQNKNKSLAGEDEESSTRPRRSSFEVDHPYDVKKNDKRLSYSQRIAGMFKPPPPPNRRGAPPTNTSTNNNNCRRPASPTNQPPAPPKPPKPSQQGSGVLSDDDGENGINNPFLSDDI